MNILLVTNTFTPHVGGVARSVEGFSAEYRKRGHRVLVLAPEYPDRPQTEPDVLRVAAIQQFNQSDFSVALPLHAGLGADIDTFRPDIVHSQHPFLLGFTALRLARHRRLPIVFTHHTLYEQYTHYLPGDSPALRRFAIELATRYANLCDHVFAPSDSIRALLQQRGVTQPITVVPTGVFPELFASGDGSGFRRQFDIPLEAFVVGHMGRLAPEKNLDFLARAVVEFIAANPRAHFLLVGRGPAEDALRATFERARLGARLHVAGILVQPELADALHAMDVFAFASTSETQGMVLTEAMAAGLPVVALDAPGAREVVRDRGNGRLLADGSPTQFAAALQWVAELGGDKLRELQRAARDTADAFSMPRTADRALTCYAGLQTQVSRQAVGLEKGWDDMANFLKTEWDLLKSLASASEASLDVGMSPVGER